MNHHILSINVRKAALLWLVILAALVASTGCQLGPNEPQTSEPGGKFAVIRHALSNTVTSPTTTIIINRHGKCLDLKDGNTNNGANIQQWRCITGNTNQEFVLVDDGNYYYLQHKASGKCVDVSGGSSNNGTNIQLWDCVEGNQNQRFKLKSLSGNNFQIRNLRTDKCLDLSGGGSANGTNIQLWSCNSSNANQSFRRGSNANTSSLTLDLEGVGVNNNLDWFVVAAADRNGNILYQHTYHSVSRQLASETYSTDSELGWASVSKSVTGAAVTRAAATHNFDTSALVTNYLPSYNPSTYLKNGPGSSTIKNLTSGERKIYIKNLMHMTAGVHHYNELPSPFSNNPSSNCSSSNPNYCDNHTDVLSLFASAPLVYKPRNKYHYSTHGYTVLGAALEAAVGESYLSYVNREIFTRLGINNVSLWHSKKNWKLAGGGIKGSVKTMAQFCAGLDRSKFFHNSSSLDNQYRSQHFSTTTNSGSYARGIFVDNFPIPYASHSGVGDSYNDPYGDSDHTSYIRSNRFKGVCVAVITNEKGTNKCGNQDCRKKIVNKVLDKY